MKSSILWLALAASLSCVAASQAADAQKTLAVRDFTDSVAPADQVAYEAGIKSLNDCFRQHGSKFTWTAWVHETGDTYSYSYTSDALPWSAFDDMQATFTACAGTNRANVNPHLKSEISGFMVVRPDMSHMAKGMTLSQPYIEVINFKLKPGHEAHQAFVDVAKKIAAAADKSKWPNYYAFSEIRDAAGGPDFVLVLPAKSWAELGKEPDTPVWQMVENVYGKADAQDMRKSFNDVVLEQNAHIDSYSADLSYKGSSK